MVGCLSHFSGPGYQVRGGVQEDSRIDRKGDRWLDGLIKELSGPRRGETYE